MLKMLYTTKISCPVQASLLRRLLVRLSGASIAPSTSQTYVRLFFLFVCAISLSYVLFAFVCEQFIYISVVRHLNPYHSSIIYLKANSFRLPIQYLFSFYAFSLSQVNEFFFSSWIFNFIRSLSLSLFLYFFSQYDFICVSVLFLLSAQSSLKLVSLLVKQMLVPRSLSQSRQLTSRFKSVLSDLLDVCRFVLLLPLSRLLNDQCDKIGLFW